MPSKKIRIRRAQPFKHEQIDSEVMQEQLSFTKRGLGGYFASKGSKRSGTGLSSIPSDKFGGLSEEQFLMSKLLNIDPKGAEYYAKVDEYFMEINTLVPHGERGLELEIGLDDNTQLVSAANTPFDIEEYIRYRHALKHPLCAASPEEAKGNQLYAYYMEDPEKVMENQMLDADIADKALIDYQTIKDKVDQMRWLVEVLKFELKPVKGKPKINSHIASKDELILACRELAVEKPAKFHTTANDANLKKRWFINSLIDGGFLKRVGSSTIQVVESGELLGENMNEVLINLWSSQNTVLLNQLKANLNEFHRNPIGAEQD